MHTQKQSFPYRALIAGAVLLWFGLKTFSYLTYTTPPHLMLNAPSNDATVAGTIACSVAANNGYKISHVEATLDGQELAIAHADRIRSKSFDLPFNLDTSVLSDGEHLLKVTAVDASYNKNRTLLSRRFCVDNKKLEVAFDNSEYTTAQGKTIHIKLKSNKPLVQAKVSFLGVEYPCYKESSHSTGSYEGFIPVSCQEVARSAELTAQVADAVNNTHLLTSQVTINQTEFPKQKGFSVSSKKIAHEREVSLSERTLETALEKLAIESEEEKLWAGSFIMPTTVKRITTPHGEIRCTAERGRHQHRGIDLVNNTPKSVIWSAARGKVVLMDRYALTGNTVVVDHGHGVQTLYAHLDSFAPDLEVGTIIRQGAPIGKMGSTGYASAAHLHFELLLNGTSVDPQQWCEIVA